MAKEISKIENNNELVQDFKLFAFVKVFNVSADIFNKTTYELFTVCKLSEFGVPEGNRTPDLQFRKLSLYPTELLAHIMPFIVTYYFLFCKECIFGF